MTLIIGWVIIGAAAAMALTSFLSGRGAGGSTIVNLIAGVVGGFIGGYVFLLLGPSVVGPGQTSCSRCWEPQFSRSAAC